MKRNTKGLQNDYRAMTARKPVDPDLYLAMLRLEVRRELRRKAVETRRACWL